MKTIEEVFKFNVRSLRSGKTQAEVSEGSGIPFSTYQTMEAGVIPAKKENLIALAKFHQVPETQFFLDPQLTRPTVQEALKVIQEHIEITGVMIKKDQEFKNIAENPLIQRISKLTKEEQAQLETTVRLMERNKERSAAPSKLKKDVG